MKILTPNLADLCTLVSSGDRSGYPSANVQHFHLSRVWRSLTDTADQSLLFDAGAGKTLTIDSAAILAHNIPAGATVTVMMNDVDSWGAPPVSVVATWNAGPIVVDLGGNQTHRLCKIIIQNAAGAGYVQIGRVILADAWEPTLGLSSTFTKTFDDTSNVTRAPSGQEFSDIGVVANIYIGELTYPDDTTRRALEAIYCAVGQRIPFLLIVDPANTDKLPPLYCRFDALPSFTAAVAWYWANAAVRFKECF
jgi:hypothetical protein